MFLEPGVDGNFSKNENGIYRMEGETINGYYIVVLAGYLNS
jgi:hypothetical protein